MKNYLALTSALLVMVAANSWAGGDVAAGKAIAEKNGCAACHGADFNKTIDATYPKLAGQHADYIKHALVAYKHGGDKPNGRVNAIMNGQAQMLSDKDIENVSAYISSLPGTLVLKK